MCPFNQTHPNTIVDLSSDEACPLRKNLEVLYELYGESGQDAPICSNPKCNGAYAVSICLKCQKALCKHCENFHNLFFDDCCDQFTNAPASSEMMGHVIVPVYEVYIPKESLDVIKAKSKELQIRHESKKHSTEAERNRQKRLSQQPLSARNSERSFVFTAPARQGAAHGHVPPAHALPALPPKSQSQRNLTASGSGGIGSGSGSNSSSESEDPLPPGWVKLFDGKSGKYYYYNKSLQKTSWIRPVMPVQLQQQQQQQQMQQQGMHGRQGSQGNLYGSQRGTLPRQQSQGNIQGQQRNQQQQEVLPPGWVKLVDSKSGRVYYYNKALQKTSWTKPTQ